VAFTLKIVTAFQARNACGDFLADEVSEQAWFMTGKPQRKPLSPSEARSLILSSTSVTTEG
jgi:hypothetical protein